MVAIAAPIYMRLVNLIGQSMATNQPKQIVSKTSNERQYYSGYFLLQLLCEFLYYLAVYELLHCTWLSNGCYLTII